MSIIYAHSVEGRPRSDWETLPDHARAVAARAADFARSFGGQDVAAMLGWAHDIGKIKPRFQAKLAGDWNAEPHSGEGARLMLARCGGFGPLLAACIAGHHSGLPDLADMKRRLAAIPEPALPDWMPAPVVPAPFGPLTGQLSPFTIQFAVRMLFSCLVDADELETAAFHDRIQGRALTRAPARVTEAHRADFDAFVGRFSAATGQVNTLRAEILTHARAQAVHRPGLFTLTVPTGGGKTLTSLGFALDHALHHGLERVIHVISATSGKFSLLFQFVNHGPSPPPSRGRGSKRDSLVTCASVSSRNETSGVVFSTVHDQSGRMDQAFSADSHHSDS